MEKVINRFLFLILIGTLTISCEKKVDQVRPSAGTKFKSIDNKSNDVIYISEANFETEFDSFAQNFFTENPHGLINLTYIPEESQYALITMDVGPVNPSGDRIICSSNDFSTMMGCLNRHRNFAIGFDGCAYGYNVNVYDDGSGRISYEGFVQC